MLGARTECLGKVGVCLFFSESVGGRCRIVRRRRVRPPAHRIERFKVVEFHRKMDPEKD